MANIKNLSMHGTNLLGFELLGKLILEELQLIRKDMRDEMQKVGSELKELYGVHKKILSKIDNKLSHVTITQQNKEAFMSDDSVILNENSFQSSVKGAVSDVMLPEELNNDIQDSPSNELIDDEEGSSQLSLISDNNNRNVCNVSSMFEGKKIIVKEEVNSFAETDLRNCYVAHDESSHISAYDKGSTSSYELICNNSTSEPTTFSSSNELFSTGSKYSICNPLHKKTDSSNMNINISGIETSISKVVQNENESTLSLNTQIEKFSSTNTSDSSSMIDLEESLNFRCQFCRKPFRHFSSYQSHVRTHTGEKPFTCKLCNKNFTQKGNLTKHMLLHKNEKPFKCDVCGKQFAQKGSLKSHLLRHTKNDFFKCSICDKSFKQLTHLVAHEQVHQM